MNAPTTGNSAPVPSVASSKPPSSPPPPPKPAAASTTSEKRKPAAANMPAPPRPIAFYDTSRKTFWWKNPRGIFVELTETSFKRLLHDAGFPRCEKGGKISSLDHEIVTYQKTDDIAYATPLAGYSQGLLEMCGQRILVTSSPTKITPRAGRFPLIEKLHENLFLDPICDQRPYVFGWLKCALEILYGDRRRPGQALAIAGPHDSGKSLWQKLVTELLGGRVAKPYRYMYGDTAFNADLFGAEHLMIEDEVASTDLRRRRHFGARIKEFAVNEVQSCHPKHRPALSLKPCWRLTISLNDEPENLMILPPLDESLLDKIMLLRANKRPMPMPTTTAEQRNKFWQALVAEIPAFIQCLLSYEIPRELRSERFGVTHYHHPALLEALNELAPEQQLLSLIDEAVFYDEKPVWEGTAEALAFVFLESESKYVVNVAQRLLRWPNAIGSYLGRLRQRYPQRFESFRKGGKRIWRIKRLADDTIPPPTAD